MLEMFGFCETRGVFVFCEARGVFGYASRTVSYAKELTSVPICYSRGNGFNTPLSRLLHIVLCTQVRRCQSLVVVVCFRFRS